MEKVFTVLGVILAFFVLAFVFAAILAWVDRAIATRYTEAERYSFNLPIGGRWIAI